MEFRQSMQTTIKRAYTENRTISHYTNTTVRGEVQPGQSLTLYQTVISMNGARLSSSIYNYRQGVSTVKLPAKISFNFGAALPLLKQLGNTRPGSANRDEWDTIRNQYYWHQNEPIDAQVRGMLAVFKSTHPRVDNRREWEHIRGRSSRILEMDQANCHHTVRFFCDMLRSITPGSENTVEWRSIRAKADHCLS